MGSTTPSVKYLQVRKKGGKSVVLVNSVEHVSRQAIYFTGVVEVVQQCYHLHGLGAPHPSRNAVPLAANGDKRCEMNVLTYKSN